MFQKRHYEVIAEALREARRMDPGNVGYASALDTAAGKLADEFRRDNPKFNRDRFLEAAGVGVPFAGRL